MLASPGLLPFAALSQTRDRAATLRQAAQQIEQIRDRRTQSNLSASAAILAGLVLEKALIQQILRRDLMQESVIYQDIREEAFQEGESKLVLRQLTRRFGTLPPELEEPVKALSLEQIEALAEALLDFQTLEELGAWLEQRS